jgi:hypothetical protein
MHEQWKEFLSNHKFIEIKLVVLDSLEAEIKKIMVWGQLVKKLARPPSQLEHSGIHLSSQSTREAEIQRIMIPG